MDDADIWKMLYVEYTNTFLVILIRKDYYPHICSRVTHSQINIDLMLSLS